MMDTKYTRFAAQCWWRPHATWQVCVKGLKYKKYFFIHQRAADDEEFDFSGPCQTWTSPNRGQSPFRRCVTSKKSPMVGAYKPTHHHHYCVVSRQYFSHDSIGNRTSCCQPITDVISSLLAVPWSHWEPNTDVPNFAAIRPVHRSSIQQLPSSAGLVLVDAACVVARILD